MLVTRSRALALPPTSSHRNVPHGSPGSPVPLARLAEMPGLIYVVIVVVAELGLHAVASRAGKDLVRLLQCLRFRWILGIFPGLGSLGGFLVDRRS